MSRAVGSIEKSAWAARFKACAPFQFKEALEVAERLNWVVIEHRDDHSAKGDCLWAILPDVNPEFWLDATPTKDEAIAICEAMGWPIRMDCASTQKGLCWKISERPGVESETQDHSPARAIITHSGGSGGPAFSSWTICAS